MKHPDKWRETIDPFSLTYKSFHTIEILGYPHAGNDVFHAMGIYDGKEVRAYIKVARQKGAAIENEVAILSQLHLPIYPTVIDYGFTGTPFSVTLELPGERLSTIVGENEMLESLSFMEEYGTTLARLHLLSISAEPVKDRRFFHAPPDELLKPWTWRNAKAILRILPRVLFNASAMGIFTMQIFFGTTIISAAFWILNCPV